MLVATAAGGRDQESEGNEKSFDGALKTVLEF